MGFTYTGDNSSLEPMIGYSQTVGSTKGTPSDVTVTKGTTFTGVNDTEASVSATQFRARRFEITDYKRVPKYVFAYVKGANASSAGNITVTFEGTPIQGSNTFFPLSTQMVIALNGTSVVSDASAYDELDLAVTGMKEIRVKSVQNADASYNADVQIYICRK